MVLPIVAYGNPILRKTAVDITPDYPDLRKFIADMWDTMRNSHGVGLAAPQVNRSIRLFIVDSLQILENLEDADKPKYEGQVGTKQVFINPNIVQLEGEEWVYNEGCLSIPKIREDVTRLKTVVLDYLDEDFLPHRETFSGITARVILHEYDHIEGKLFIDYLKPLKRKLLNGKLRDISMGRIEVDYKMRFNK